MNKLVNYKNIYHDTAAKDTYLQQLDKNGNNVKQQATTIINTFPQYNYIQVYKKIK
jgi:hypothetical protein